MRADGDSLFFYADQSADGTFGRHIRKSSPCLGLQTGADLVSAFYGSYPKLWDFVVDDAKLYYVNENDEIEWVPK